VKHLFVYKYIDIYQISIRHFFLARLQRISDFLLIVRCV